MGKGVGDRYRGQVLMDGMRDEYIGEPTSVIGDGLGRAGFVSGVWT